MLVGILICWSHKSWTQEVVFFSLILVGFWEDKQRALLQRTARSHILLIYTIQTVSVDDSLSRWQDESFYWSKPNLEPFRSLESIGIRFAKDVQ